MTEMSIEHLRQEVFQLFDTMQQFRKELASLRHPEAPEDRFDTMSEQLDAIVKGTEDATNTILQSVEQIADQMAAHRAEITAAGDSAWIDEIDNHINAVFEACAFQDITGQRTNKVVQSLKYIDGKLNALVQLWGTTGLSSEPLPQDPNKVKPAGEQLDGPALKGEGVSQEDIDKMFD